MNELIEQCDKILEYEINTDKIRANNSVFAKPAARALKIAYDSLNAIEWSNNGDWKSKKAQAAMEEMSSQFKKGTE